MLADFPVDIVDDLSAATLDQLQIDIVIHLAGIAHDLAGHYQERDYELANYEMTKMIYEEFAPSKATAFVFVSSVKALIDKADEIVTEETTARPASPYGKSKRKAEEYIMAQNTGGKQNYILRPCMIHGPGNKGNLNLLYKFIHSGVPYPWGLFAISDLFFPLLIFAL
ncbi:MAG: NAD-dependent epimerase/dehydratase family protein [Cyclobacteriaceae bacterium]|nr:NAD-dependent epimerase/dehydratase family protein [Cyclobacteriaceae bacterium]